MTANEGAATLKFMIDARCVTSHQEAFRFSSAASGSSAGGAKIERLVTTGPACASTRASAHLAIVALLASSASARASTRRPRRASRVRDREFSHRERRRPAEGDRRLRHVRPSERRARQRRAAAVALHGDASRLRVADRTRSRARHGDTVSRRHGAVRQRTFVVAEQYAGAVSRSALSGDDDPRQRRRRSPAADARSQGHAPARASSASRWAREQAFQWAVSYPDFADRIVATSGTAKTYGHGIARLEGQIAALTTDPTFNNGDYTTPPKKGIEAFGMVWAAWLYSQEWWRRELWKTNARRARRSSSTCRPSAPTSSPAPTRTTSFFRRARGRSTTSARRRASTATSNARCGRSRFRFSTCRRRRISTFPVGDARYEAQFMSTVSLVPIPSLWGHPAGAGANPEDRDFLNQTISAFLAGGSQRTR